MPEVNANEEKIGGNITLINFKLEPIEMIVVKKIVGNYVKKISERAGYKELKLRLKQHEHGKGFLNELDAEAIITREREGGENIVLSSSGQDYNLFNALAGVMEKILNEAEGKLKL